MFLNHSLQMNCQCTMRSFLCQLSFLVLLFLIFVCTNSKFLKFYTAFFCTCDKDILLLRCYWLFVLFIYYFTVLFCFLIVHSSWLVHSWVFLGFFLISLKMLYWISKMSMLLKYLIFAGYKIILQP